MGISCDKPSSIHEAEMPECVVVPVQPKYLCEKCGADRYKEDCKGADRMKCPMMGYAAPLLAAKEQK
jgi:hypothetical protein